MFSIVAAAVTIKKKIANTTSKEGLKKVSLHSKIFSEIPSYPSPSTKIKIKIEQSSAYSSVHSRDLCCCCFYFFCLIFTGRQLFLPR